MAGPSAHGQHNKAHKAGRKAGASAREKHALKKQEAKRRPIRAKGDTGISRAQERGNAAKMLRQKHRHELLESRRQHGAPRVVALLPLSAEVDVERCWAALLGACEVAQPSSSTSPAAAANKDGMDVDAQGSEGSARPLAPTAVSLASAQKRTMTLLPPPHDMRDPLAIVDLARSAEVIVLAIPGAPAVDAADEQGLAALGILRAMGLPTLVGLVQTAGDSLKEKSAARKRGSALLAREVSGQHAVFTTAGGADAQQLTRHLAEVRLSIPQWRQQRPAILVQSAQYLPSAVGDGTLLLSGYVRQRGLNVNGLLHIVGAGDFQMDRIDGLINLQTSQPSNGGYTDGEADGGMGFTRLLAQADAEAREPLTRENDADPLAGEQTWPTEQEMEDAHHEVRQKRRRLPVGTSDYQAAWLLDAEDYGAEGDSDEEHAADDLRPSQPPSTAATSAADDLYMDDGTATEAGDLMDEDKYNGPDRDAFEERKRLQQAQQDHLQFPDEIDTPSGVAASKRFARYRGLKSWRTSGWDPKEELPPEYSRVFAFENFKRAHKRAQAAAEGAGSGAELRGVAVGTLVCVHVAAVPQDAAMRVVQRVTAFQEGAAMPLVATGLLQHEAKLSVLNFGIKKVAACGAPVANKDELLFVSGVRTFSARPIFSTDEPHADKHKMERYLQHGHGVVATVYGPISFPPQPVLLFRTSSDGDHALVATGALRSTDPDRVVLKKAVLTGFPVKVHKKKAVVRWMFHSPEDVRWFRPVDLWTKHGRQGRIKEPVGTHGAMKCIFDGPVQQKDSVCIALYKRVYPKWPQNMQFA